MYTKPIPVDFTIWKLQPLKGPLKLMKLEIFFKVTTTDTILLSKRPGYKPKPEFDGIGLLQNLEAVSDIVSAIIWKHHSIEYALPVLELLADYKKMFEINPQLETVATEFVLLKKGIETHSRIWYRSHELHRKVMAIRNHYADLPLPDDLSNISELRSGISVHKTVQKN